MCLYVYFQIAFDIAFVGCPFIGGVEQIDNITKLTTDVTSIGAQPTASGT
jgi:hypothetical protein